MVPDEPLDPVELLPVELLPIEPPVVGDFVVWLLYLLDGTCDCCLLEWLIRPEDGLVDVPEDEPAVPGDIVGEVDVLPVEFWANAVPANSRAAAAVTISVRIGGSFE